MQNGKALRIVKNSLASIAIPLGVFIILQLICTLSGVSFLSSGNYKSLVVNIFYIMFIGCGLYFNIPSGRFDFSVGAIIVLSSIIGGNIALKLGFGGIGLLICCLVCGALLGAISGLAYVLLGLPATVVSLGVTLVFESLTFILFDGKGVVLIGKNYMLYLIQFPYIYILGAVIFVALIILVNFTKFGYNYRALAVGQHIAVNTGINEKVNAVLCYTLCGALSAAAGVLTLSRTGTASASLGLGSIMAMFSGFLPMFIGGIIAKYSEAITGIFFGAVASSLLNAGFASLGMSLSAQNIIGAFILLGFLVYSRNEHKFKEYTLIRKRKTEAILKVP